jgi:hypothetical protein
MDGIPDTKDYGIVTAIGPHEAKLKVAGTVMSKPGDIDWMLSCLNAQEIE